MADYLIHDSTLEDIADAIRNKTGGSSLIAPEDMSTEIASISGGGSSYEMKLLYETAPTTEQVSAIKIDFTSSMLGYDVYRIVLLGTFAKQPYPYVGINTETNTAYLNPVGGTSPYNSHWECYVAKLGTSYVAYLGSRANFVSGDLSYFHTRSYAADGYFNTGFVVQIWGCNYENS